jgi:hypothetical protein
MHKKKFGQAYRKDLLNRILRKFALHFCYFSSIYYEFYKFKLIS